MGARRSLGRAMQVTLTVDALVADLGHARDEGHGY